MAELFPLHHMPQNSNVAIVLFQAVSKLVMSVAIADKIIIISGCGM